MALRLVAMLLLALAPPASAAGIVEHALEVELAPGAGRIAVRDRVRLPAAPPGSSVTVALNAAFSPSLEAPAGAVLQSLDTSGSSRWRRHRVILPEGAHAFTLRYAGVLPQAIRSEGVFLSGADGWYPRTGDALMRFSLAVALPSGWSAVSQGAQHAPGDGAHGVVWTEHHAQEDIYLVAGRFATYRGAAAEVEALVYLRTPDAALARRYLEVTPRYLEEYARLIGPYAYAKFALVENFEQTGYGMPSFTLLGSRVIRLPFILHSSYPHEILHNWWGNGVYVDTAGGNWSEGLTAYLADHRIQARRGGGAAYRREALQKYRNYASEARDFALRDFRGGHGDATQAVGYNKTLMVFHMLRRRLGDERFFAGLRRFYREWRFRRAGYADLRAAFEAEAGADLGSFFAQWIERTGAPALALADVRTGRGAHGYRITGALVQTQPGPAYALRVPIAVHVDGEREPVRRTLSTEAKHEAFDLGVEARPLRLEIDPEFDLFRRLSRAEIPPALGELFGARDVLFVLPAQAAPALRERYRALAEALGAAEITTDAALAGLPAQRPVWLLGWDNRHRPRLREALAAEDIASDGDALGVEGRTLERSEHCVVLSARRDASDPNAAPLAWLGCEVAAAFAGLARKLPHYGKYSYLAFAGAEPQNVLKGQWPVRASPLRVDLTRKN